MPTEMELTLEQTQQGVSYEVSFDESNTNVLERFDTPAGNPVKEILLKLNLPDHRSLKDGVIRLVPVQAESHQDSCHNAHPRPTNIEIKEFQEDATVKLFSLTNHERLMSMLDPEVKVHMVPAVVDEYLGSSLKDTLQKDEDDLDRVVPDLRKRDREEDEDTSAGSNQGKRKRSSGQGSRTSRHLTSKETSPGVELYLTLQKRTGLKNEWNAVESPQMVEELFSPKSLFIMLSIAKDPLTFNELMATPIDFSNFAKNHLKLDKITKADLVKPVYNLLKGTCQSIIELEYNMEEYFKAQTDRLKWENPEGDRCLFDLSKSLPLKGHPGHITIAVEYFFNNDLEYLKSKDSERKYTTSITKTKAARFSKHDVFSPLKILSLVSVKAKKLHGYGYLEEILVRRADRQLYKFKEGDFVNLHLNDIEDMLLLVVQHKLFHLDGEVIKKLNITNPQKDFPRISTKELCTPSFDPPGVIYEDLSHQKRLMRADELYKFSDGTLKKVHDTLYHRLLNFRFGYNKDMPKRKWLDSDKRQLGIMVDLINKQMLERQILENLEISVGARELKMDCRLM
ncbi:hypothetical protein Tco_1044951 [Tanacetum coccineum]|uniref:Uncharacterized protein n=1 Tax=Tanacetum coccineum TaxID=301880 RepID=A0ABQ5GRC6_9ASTR